MHINVLKISKAQHKQEQEWQQEQECSPDYTKEEYIALVHNRRGETIFFSNLHTVIILFPGGSEFRGCV